MSADGGESVLARGREVAGDAEIVEQGGFGGGDVGGRGAVVEIDEEGDEAFDERGIGFELEAENAVAEFSDDPDLGDAAVDAVGIAFEGVGEGGAAAPTAWSRWTSPSANTSKPVKSAPARLT